jgi:CubicO group peptidase (beta-lactamase class C family)
MKKLTFISYCLLQTLYAMSQISASIATGNPVLSSRTDSLVQNVVLKFMSNTSRVGLSIGIIKNGKTYTYNYGTIKKGYKVLPTANTVYEIGSISKTFTGFLLARAIVDKKIKIDDDIRNYLHGWYPNLEYDGQPIRIMHLANHTSGLPPFLPDRPDLFQRPQDSIPFLMANLHRDYTKEQFLKDLHTIKLDTVPGYNYRYSNTAAQLLGFILENVYNKTFGELIQQYITGPLAMKQTKVSDKTGMAGLAEGYGSSGNRMPYMPVLMKPSGGIYSSVSNMLNYIRFQLNEKNKPVRLSHIATMNYTDSTGIGLFWRINRIQNKTRKIWHTGGTFGFSSYCVFYPEMNAGIVLLSNEFDATSQGELVHIAEELYETIVKE